MQSFVGAEGDGSGGGGGVILAYSLAEDRVGGGDSGTVGVYPEFEGARVELGVDCLGRGADFD